MNYFGKNVICSFTHFKNKNKTVLLHEISFL